MLAQHGPHCSHTEERFSDIWRQYGDLVDSLGRHSHSVVAVLCDGGLITQPFIQAQIKENIKAPRHWPLRGEFNGER